MPRELKLGQIVVVLLATQIQSAALQHQIIIFQTFLAIARTPFVVDSKSLHRCDPWVSKNKNGD